MIKTIAFASLVVSCSLLSNVALAEHPATIYHCPPVANVQATLDNHQYQLTYQSEQYTLFVGSTKVNKFKEVLLTKSIPAIDCVYTTANDRYFVMAKINAGHFAIVNQYVWQQDAPIVWQCVDGVNDCAFEATSFI